MMNDFYHKLCFKETKNNGCKSLPEVQDTNSLQENYEFDGYTSPKKTLEVKKFDNISISSFWANENINHKSIDTCFSNAFGSFQSQINSISISSTDLNKSTDLSK